MTGAQVTGGTHVTSGPYVIGGIHDAVSRPTYVKGVTNVTMEPRLRLCYR